MREIVLVAIALMIPIIGWASLDNFDHSPIRSDTECRQCHPRLLPTHTLARPDKPTGDLPLDGAGTMGCLTCPA